MKREKCKEKYTGLDMMNLKSSLANYTYKQWKSIEVKSPSTIQRIEEMSCEL
jgi:hypothetical protein